MTSVLPQRVYVNGFPKAGTHLAELYVAATTPPGASRPWLVGVRDNGWSDEWLPYTAVVSRLGQWPKRGYFKGHMPYRDDMAAAFFKHKVSMVFVYRDLRDTAVSQAYHVLNNEINPSKDDKLKHPGKALYQAMGNFEDVLIAIIRGVARFPGVLERWQMYTGWLDVPWVLPVSFEEMRYNRRETGLAILDYVAKQTGAYYGRDVTLDNVSRNKLMKTMLRLVRKAKPTTYRKGKSGGWREHWTPRVAEAWTQEAEKWQLQTVI